MHLDIRTGATCLALLATGVGLSGCGQIVEQYQHATAASGGAAPLTSTEAAAAFRESLTKCDAYRRSVSVTQRQGGATLALASATAGAIGLALVPAGAATLAGFTAAGTVLAAGSAQLSGTTYLGLSSRDVSRRLTHYYNDKMEELGRTSYTVEQVYALHSRCSLDYVSAQPEPTAGGNPQ